MQNETKTQAPAQTPEKGRVYTVEAGGKKTQLTLDELLLCAKCLLMKQGGANGGKTEQTPPADAEFVRFVGKYPDVREFPQSVAERIVGGESPLDAYREYEIASLKARIAALEGNAENAVKSTGSARGDAADNELTELQSAFEAMFRR